MVLKRPYLSGVDITLEKSEYDLLIGILCSMAGKTTGIAAFTASLYVAIIPSEKIILIRAMCSVT